MNPRLRTILLKARDANMPADNIDRAIKKGTGELPGVVFEEVTYEGYGPGGVAIIVKVTTDNKNRAASDVRSVFTRYGGNLAGAGAVAFQFLHAGQFLIGKDQAGEDALMEIALDAGADDVIASADGFEVRCGVHAFDKVAHALEQKGIKPESAEIAYIPDEHGARHRCGRRRDAPQAPRRPRGARRRAAGLLQRGNGRRRRRGGRGGMTHAGLARPRPRGVGWAADMTDDAELPPASGSAPRHLAPGDVGLVSPRDFVHAHPFAFQSGQALPGFTLRYETYGTLNATRDNAVLICHALSGDHHCAGWHSPEDRKPGWWNNLIGPGKAVDTRRFFVVCANVLGGCQGSTGPSSTDPATGRPYGIAFPARHRPRHGALAEAAARPPRRGRAPRRDRRLDGRHDRDPVRDRVSGLRPPRGRHGDDRPRKRPGDRLQRGRPPGNHAGSGLEQGRLPEGRRPAGRASRSPA